MVCKPGRAVLPSARYQYVLDLFCKLVDSNGRVGCLIPTVDVLQHPLSLVNVNGVQHQTSRLVIEPFLGTCVHHSPRLNLFTNRQSLILFTSVFFLEIFCILM